MNELEFQAEVDSVFLRLEEAIEKVSDDIDFESNQGILKIMLPSGTVVLSRQSALQEIWLASPQGAYHFQYTAAGWATRGGQSLLVLIKAMLQEAI